MKYTPLSSLQNPYPSPSKYRVNESGGATLQGVYPQNKLDFTLPSDLSDFTVIPDSSFRFIVAVSDNNAANSVLDLLVSEGLYNDLVRANNEPNPYFLNTILNPNTWVYIYTDSLHKTFQTQQELERKIGVKVDYNVIYDNEGIPDYTRIGKFIDWIISPSKLEDIDSGGVIPLEDLEVRFSLGAYDVESSQWVSAEESAFLSKIDDLEDELRSVRNDLQDIDNFLSNPQSFRGDGAVAALLGASATSLVLGVSTTLPAVATALTLSAQQVVAKAAAKLAFEGVKTQISAQIVNQAAGKIATSFLGGPVGIGIAVVGIIASILTSKKKKREQEERIRKYEEYIKKITAEQVRLLEREQKLISDIEKVRTNQPISNTNDSQISNQITSGGNNTTQTNSGGSIPSTSIGDSTTFIDPFEAERQFRELQ